MSWFYRNIIRRGLFTQESERIHHWVMQSLAFASRHPLALGITRRLYSTSDLPVHLWNLRFPNPIGIAAGMDKDAEAVPIWAALGFGFSELGGVTWHPQEGNPKPRMFRVIPDQGIINRMGFNNPGAEVFVQHLAYWKKSGLWPKHPVGINLGKSKITPLAEAPGEYARLVETLTPYADFFVINVSSPNTQDLRKLQEANWLRDILQTITNRERPILLKIAPDLSWPEIDQILEISLAHNLSGIVATNTTLQRPDSPLPLYRQTGGLSGAPLRQRSTEVIRYIHQHTQGQLPIIGVGGILTVKDALEKLEAGASLLQVYTGMVYHGPAIAKSLVNGLRTHRGTQTPQELI